MRPSNSRPRGHIIREDEPRGGVVIASRRQERILSLTAYVFEVLGTASEAHDSGRATRHIQVEPERGEPEIVGRDHVLEKREPTSPIILAPPEIEHHMRAA